MSEKSEIQNPKSAMEAGASLSLFHPLIRKWFESGFKHPTDVQQQSWPKIADGEHVLLTAPTGSGKTLTAFLWAINQLLSGAVPNGQTSVLYISPLKALNNDIRRNLTGPLIELKQVFKNAGQSFPEISVQTRSGDTPQSERRRMLNKPPDILITTPESLNLMLSSLGGRSILGDIRTVILDEIHSVVGNKRGVHLITAVDRLVQLSGEFQRIALSATVRPLDTVAAFIGGLRREGPGKKYVPRPVSLIDSKMKKKLSVSVRYPEDDVDKDSEDPIWPALVKEFKQIVHGHQSTLLFVNSRAQAENLTHRMNSGEEAPLAYAHHGSLSREIRETVERKLKAGELKAIIATSSLEMGIDIGALDEVVLVQSPPSISSAIQRLGRAGHQVDAISRGTIFPTHSRDFLHAAVLAKAIMDHDIEAVKPIEGPLDVLAQVLISMTGIETWDIDDLYSMIRTSYPYRNLSREQFDRVLNMLAGKYADRQLRELKPRVSIDRLENTVSARKGALRALYMSGGTIPDRGYFQLRHLRSHSKIGELDEEFVWENPEGSAFTLGTQTWRVEKVTHNDVFVLPGNPANPGPPFWKAEETSRDAHFSDRIGIFLEMANDRLEDPALAAELVKEYHMEAAAADQLLTFLRGQRKESGADLPHRHHLLIERMETGPGGAPGTQIVLHTLWGGSLNKPFAMALQAAWQERYGHQIEIYSDDDTLVLVLPEDVDSGDLLSMVTAAQLPELLRRKLESSGFFGARFRECAGRSLLLTRNRASERMPLWLSRLRSQKLLDSVLNHEDFPILLETWRTCLHDSFNIDRLQMMIGELESGIVRWSETTTQRATPFSQSIAWRQVDKYMYMDDRPSSDRGSNLRGDLLHDLVFNPGLRPTVPAHIVSAFEEKRQRLSPGYAPGDASELIDWVKERRMIPLAEWDQLLKCIERDHGQEGLQQMEAARAKLLCIEAAGAVTVVAAEYAGRIRRAFFPSQAIALCSMETGQPAAAPLVDNSELNEDGTGDEELAGIILGEWLSFYGPRPADFAHLATGGDKNILQLLLEDLVSSNSIIAGALIDDVAGELVCDSENFEILLRIRRAGLRPDFEALGIDYLPLFLATIQGLTHPREGDERLPEVLEQLEGLTLDAGAWEADIFPSRIREYRPAMLDEVMMESSLGWIGSPGQKIMFCLEENRELMELEVTDPLYRGDADRAAKPSSPAEFEALFTDRYSRYDFSALIGLTGQSASELAAMLWEAVWSGRIVNDTMMSLRRGIENRFKVPDVTPAGTARQSRPRGSGRRTLFSKWKGSVPFAGNWHKLPNLELSDDLLEIEERRKERARLLLDRYGVLFRELLERELPPFRWAAVFRALRMMELAGEIYSGYFFEDIPGPQFISRKAFQILNRPLPVAAIYFMNAIDPASPCGIGLAGQGRGFPRRVPGSGLVLHGCDLVACSERNGKTLRFFIPPDHEHIQEYLLHLRHLLDRALQPLRKITVELINEIPAPQSPYLQCLETSFSVVRELKKVSLYRKMN